MSESFVSGVQARVKKRLHFGEKRKPQIRCAHAGRLAREDGFEQCGLAGFVSAVEYSRGLVIPFVQASEDLIALLLERGGRGVVLSGTKICGAANNIH